MGLAPGARRFALPPLVLALVLALVAPPLGFLALVVGVCVMWFYRDPSRTPPARGIVSPADGRVSVIREEGDRLRVGVYMNVVDVHVIRAPAKGYVESIDHRTGAHRPAFSKDSDRNERVDVDFGRHEVSLIAGAFARRITPYVDVGDTVERGARIGHIAFGSRADVVLPPGISREDLRVGRGDRVRAGETVLVEFSG